MIEYEKMKKGMIYDALTEKIGTEAKNTHRLCEKYNNLGADDVKRKNKLLKKLFPNDDFGLFRTMETPIFIDNKEIRIGKNFYSNIHFSFIGGCCVEIGDNVFIGPYCTLATGIHSLIAEERRISVDDNGIPHDYEYGKPIRIGNDVWIASNVTICGGVTIGDGRNTLFSADNACMMLCAAQKESAVQAARRLFVRYTINAFPCACL